MHLLVSHEFHLNRNVTAEMVIIMTCSENDHVLSDENRPTNLRAGFETLL
jgi:hypothetical protein